MTLPPPETAPLAIASLANLVRQGIQVYRSPRGQECRVHYTSQLRKLYDEEEPRRAPIDGGEPIFLKSTHVMKCEFGKAGPPTLPDTWAAAAYEEYSWPQPQSDPDWPSQPFCLFLAVLRGSHRFVLPIHDKRDRWVGPSFKAKAKIFRFPTPLNLPVSTYLAYGDAMRDLTLRRWLSVLLAQRSFLTEEEEGQVVEAYFTRGENDSGLSFTAYERVKRNFLQPIGDRPSFPVHYRMTLRAIRRADTFMTSEDPEHFHPIDSGEGRLVSLKGLRRQEPSLHRALLYRLAKGSIRPERINGRVYVAAGVVDEVEQARQENSRSRLPKRLPHGRHRWIALMMRSGIKRRSAERKLKRWINVLGLSEAEIEASAAKGSLVRLPPFR